MVREFYDYIIGDAPIGAIPLGRLCVADDSLRRHAYAVRRASRRVKTPVRAYPKNKTWAKLGK